MYVSQDAIYFAYCHSIMKYGIVFAINSPFSKNIFTIKNTVKSMVGAKPKTSCRDLFKKLHRDFICSRWINIFVN